MRRSVLAYLRCPTPPRKARGTCGGALEERSDALPLRVAVADDDEVLEGELVCSRCEARYPILGGVAILVVRPHRYLGRRFRSLPQVLLHADLSSQAIRWLEAQNLHRYAIAPERDNPDSDAVLHYEQPARLLDDVPIPPTFRSFLEEWAGRGPYDALAAMARHAEPVSRRVAVDTGCGVGGLVQRLASHFDQVFGVDVSFASVLIARSILLQQPRPYEHRIHTSFDVLESRELRDAARRNVEIVVADFSALPFGDGAINAIASCNVLEVAPSSPPLAEVDRVLDDHGLLLLTDPFQFWFGQAPSRCGDRLEDVRRELAARGYVSVEEHDFVPWIWYRYQRQLQVYLNYCAAWRRAPAHTNGY